MKKFLIILLSVLTLSANAQTDSLEETKKEIYQFYTYLGWVMNLEMPLQVDEITTCYSVAFDNGTFTSKFKVLLSIDDLTDEEIAEIKKESYLLAKQNARKMLESGAYGTNRTDYRWLMKTLGLKYIRSYFDIDGNFLFDTTFDYNDF